MRSSARRLAPERALPARALMTSAAAPALGPPPPPESSSRQEEALLSLPASSPPRLTPPGTRDAEAPAGDEEESGLSPS